MNLTALYENYFEKSGEQRNNLNQIVTASLIHIIVNYFVPKSNKLFLTITCREDHTCNFYNEMLLQLFSKWREWPLQIVHVQQIEIDRKIRGNRRYNMILTDSFDSFLEADINSYTLNNSYNEYIFIFLQQRDAFIPEDMQKIFNYCWQHHLINCVIQVQNAKGELLIYTYYPFTEAACNRVQVVLINQFNGTSLRHEILFPKKLRNMHGCPLKIATWHVPPYVELSRNMRRELTITGGIEGELLSELSSQLNFLLDVHVPANNEQRGDFKPNGSLTGAMRMLNNREVDFSAGGFRQSTQRSTIASATLNYYQTSFSLAAVEDIYLLTSRETLFFPFNKALWILIFCILILAMIIGGALQKLFGRRNPKNFTMGALDIFLMLLGMPAVYQPKRLATRLLNVSWMIYGLLIRTTYQALLFHMIRTHITIDVPQAIEDLPQRGYTMVMSRLTSDILRSVPALNAIEMLTLNTLWDFETMEFLDSLSLKEAESYAVVLPKDFIKYYMLNKRREGVFRIFPYDVMPFKICIYVTKHSYLMEQFDEILMLFQSSGLIYYWSRKILGGSMTAAAKQRRADHLFGLAQLEMAFAMLGWCYLVATLVFIIELLYRRVCSRCKIFRKNF